MVRTFGSTAVPFMTKRAHGVVEQEYLFAPFSAFHVVRASWNTGTTSDANEIELLAGARDNQSADEMLLASGS